VTLLSLPRIEKWKRGRRRMMMNNRRNRMKKTRWRKWWRVGDISSVWNDLFCFLSGMNPVSVGERRGIHFHFINNTIDD
jgi:hypothetical protein